MSRPIITSAITGAITGAIALIALALPASAQADDVMRDNMKQIARMGGGMHALAEACQHYKAGDLARMKQEQKRESIAAGLGAAEFDTLFQAGYTDARTKLSRGTPAQKEKACAQVNAIGKFGR